MARNCGNMILKTLLLRMITLVLQFGLSIGDHLGLLRMTIVKEKNTSDSYYLIDHKGFKRAVPDDQTMEETMKRIGASKLTLSVLSTEELNLYPSGQPLPSLALPETHTEIDILHTFIKSIEYFSPVDDIIVEEHFIPYVRNLAIAEWNGSYIAAWRAGLVMSSYVVFGWMKPDLTGIDRSNRRFDLMLKEELTLKPLPYLNGGRIQEDPRLIVTKDQNLVVLYTSFTGFVLPGNKTKLFRQCYAEGSINYSETSASGSPGVMVFSSSITLAHPVHENHKNVHQKNWMPFSYGKDLYLIISVQPLMVGKLVSVLGQSPGKVEMVYRAGGHVTAEPWDHRQFGAARGSTPAVFVRNVLLGFFHSRMIENTPNSGPIYFMGAVALCPRPPFNVLKMSKLPIAKYESMYAGPPLYFRGLSPIDHVVFPAGIVLDDDDVHMWVSYGHQDQNSTVMKVHIDALLNSLTYYNTCEEDYVPP